MKQDMKGEKSRLSLQVTSIFRYLDHSYNEEVSKQICSDQVLTLI
jgi:hypothetical protein